MSDQIHSANPGAGDDTAGIESTGDAVTVVEFGVPSSFAAGATNSVPWGQERAYFVSSAGTFVRGLRNVAAGVMLATAKCNNLGRQPWVARPSCEIVDESEIHRWGRLDDLSLLEAVIPCPPLRISASVRVYPPEWKTEQLELFDHSLSLAQEQ